MRSALLALAALASFAAATDLRELYTFTGGNGTAFCDSWDSACVELELTGETGLDFQAVLCRPGDYQGKNTDTEALAYCSYTADGTTPVSENDLVASKVGATLA